MLLYIGVFNQPLWNILSKVHLKPQEIHLITSHLSNYIDPRNIRKEDSIKVLRTYDNSLKLIIKHSMKRYEITYENGTVSVNVIEPFIERRLEVVEGKIESNLYNSLLRLREKPEIVVKFADIFGWDIDFSVETENGDEFLILLEKEYYNGKLLGYGRIYYAMYNGKRTGLKEAFYFNGNYYQRDGKSLQKMFLRSPLKIYRITSKFGRRFHPIRRKWLMHHGVDYAAPYGTPVFSVGSGWVKFAGWKGGYGKLIIIKHPKGYETRYAHLSRIAVKPGQSVEQGQYIGNVGSTGLSTGPHLHFEVRRHGKLLNPLKLKMEPKEPVPEERMDEFLSYVYKVESFLKRRLAYEKGR